MPTLPTIAEANARRMMLSSARHSLSGLRSRADPIGPFAIRWYALAYIVGILPAGSMPRPHRFEKLWGGPAPMTVVEYDDFMMWVTLGIILGGRTGYVLFYNLPHFIAHPLEIFELWNGGMSFHGGFLGCVVAIVAVRARARHSDPVARRRDRRGQPRSACSSAASPISSTANCGAGRPTCRGPWCFPNGGPMPRHPSQLYEAALEGLVLFIVLAC